MPEMRVHSSGGIVFYPTKEEKEVLDLRNSLRSELDEVRSMKDELKSELALVRSEKNAIS